MAHAASTHACGIHDPTLLARGIMNHVYPDSLHVIGAVQRAKQSGDLPMSGVSHTSKIGRQHPGESREAVRARTFENSLNVLYALGLAISERSDGAQRQGITLVVLDSMLWTRYSSDYGDVRQGLHIKGPASGDVVLVTDTSVVEAIQAGLITIERAIDIGVMRVYRDQGDTDGVLDRIASIGATPLPHAQVAMNPFDVSTSDWAPDDPLRPTR